MVRSTPLCNERFLKKKDDLQPTLNATFPLLRGLCLSGPFSAPFCGVLGGVVSFAGDIGSTEVPTAAARHFWVVERCLSTAIEEDRVHCGVVDWYLRLYPK